MTSQRSSELDLTVPGGTARAYIRKARGAAATLVLGHGAGAGFGRSPDLQALARELPGQGFSVIVIDQPWVLAGRRIASPPPRLDESWVAALAQLRRRHIGGPLVVGGRSAGARVACRTAGRLGAAGVVALAFPLHPPGSPARSRAGELAAVGVPLLVVQGSSDAFGRPDEFDPALDVRAVPGDHGFSRREASVSVVVDVVLDWLRTHPALSASAE